MPCYRPLTGWRKRVPAKNGGFGITFNRDEGVQEMQVPCGQCIGCRLERSRQWAVRCLHEAQTHEQNCFITLTYDDEHLPQFGNLVQKDFQDFFKRLRRRPEFEFYKRWPSVRRRVKYYMCGEYGQLGRPHYHACVFNLDFPDKEYLCERDGEKLFSSEILDETWQGKGYSSVGSVTFKSAAYVARYCTKKVTGEQAEEHYKRVDPLTLQEYELTPEFNAMSNGIGEEFFKYYKGDMARRDLVIVNGKKQSMPRYYVEHEELGDEALLAIKQKRKENAKVFAKENTPERLRVRERCAEARNRLLVRGLK